MESISTKIFLFFFTFMTCCVCTQKARAAEGMFFDDLPAAFAQYDSLTNTWVFGNSRVQRTVHYDTAQKGLYCSSWKDMLTGLEVANTPSSEGRLVISHQKIDLGANFGLAAPSWEFGDNEEIKGGGVQTVQIHLAGVNANAGIRVSVCYDVYPGNEPWTTKWFKIDAPGLADSLLDTIVYDLFNADSLLSDTIGCGNASSLKIITSAHVQNAMAMASILNWNASIWFRNGAFNIRMRPNAYLGPYMTLTGGNTTKAFEGFGNISLETAKFTYQVFLVDRHIMAVPGSSAPFHECYYGNMRDIIVDSTEAMVLRAKACGIGIMANDPAALTGLVHRDPSPTPALSRAALYARQTPPFLDPENEGSLGYYCATHEVPLFLYQGNDGVVNHLGVSFCNPEEAAFVASWAGELSAITNARGWFIEDRTPGSSCTQSGHPHPPGNAIVLWQEGFRKIAKAIKTSVPVIAVGRTWVWNLDVMDVADWSQPEDEDNGGPCSTWAKTVIGRAPLQPTLAFKISMGIHWAGVDSTGYESIMSRAAMVSSMMTSRGLQDAKPTEARILNKWSEWHSQNQEWLQYGQSLETTGSDSILGIMHLRNKRLNKYGCIGWWWASAPFTVKVDTRKWLLDIQDDLLIKSVRSGEPIPYAFNGTNIEIGPVTAGWDVLEISSLHSSVTDPAIDKFQQPCLEILSSPNPFNPSVVITLRTPNGLAPTIDIIDIFDINGQKVTRLALRTLPDGVVATAVWDGRDAYGSAVSGGMYMAVAAYGKTILTKKLLYVK